MRQLALEHGPLLAALFLTVGTIMALTLVDAEAPTVEVPDISFAAGDAGEEADLPAYVAHLSACERGSALPRCPSSLPESATLIGQIEPGFGVDGFLQSGQLDRYNITPTRGQVGAHLDGDMGAVLGVYAAGQPLIDPADGRRDVRGLAVPHGVEVVQVLVVNPTSAPRAYHLELQ